MGLETFPENRNVEPKKEQPSAANNMFLAQAEQNNPTIESLKQRRLNINQELGQLEMKLKRTLTPIELRETMRRKDELTSEKDMLTLQISDHRDNRKPGFEANFSGKDWRLNR